MVAFVPSVAHKGAVIPINMTPPHILTTRSMTSKAAFVAFGCALGLVLFQTPMLRAAGSVQAQALDDKAPALPLTATFEKVSGAEAGPYVLNLKNVSKESIKASATVLSSLPSHANRRTMDIPEHVIEPGQVWTISDLAAADKVTVTAPGFAPLELTVP